MIYFFEDNDNFIEVGANCVCSTEASSNPTDQKEQIGTATTSIASGPDHSYNEKEDVCKRKKIATAGVTFIYSNELDHDYVESRNLDVTAIVGSTAIDTIRCFLKERDGADSDKLSETVSHSEAVELGLACDSMNCDRIASCIAQQPKVRQRVLDHFVSSMTTNVRSVGHRKHGSVSYLMKKGDKEMSNFSWEEVFSEALDITPDLVRVLLGLMLTKANSVTDLSDIHTIIRKVSLIYGIVVNHINPELSLIQRVIAMSLHDNLCDRAVSGIMLLLANYDHKSCAKQLHCIITLLMHTCAGF